MSFHEQHSQNTSDLTQPATQQKTGWSTKKKVGVAVGSIVALAASFFAGTELGYYNARNDIAEHFANAFSEDSLNISATEEIQTNRTPTLQSTFPETLSVGESVEVPCSMYKARRWFLHDNHPDRHSIQCSLLQQLCRTWQICRFDF